LARDVEKGYAPNLPMPGKNWENHLSEEESEVMVHWTQTKPHDMLRARLASLQTQMDALKNTIARFKEEDVTETVLQDATSELRRLENVHKDTATRIEKQRKAARRNK
jgi:anti-sigma factor RsiW